MTTTAQTMLNRFRHISKNSTAPAPVAPTASMENGTDPNAPPLSAASSHITSNHQTQSLPPEEAPKEVHMLSSQAIEDLLNCIPDSPLPPLALADGGNAFDGDATNDWFYPGRSLRNGTLPEVDLVEGQFVELFAIPFAQ
jgi:hypothetical protein